MTEFDSTLGTKSNHFIHQCHCMRAIKPIQEIYELMTKNLHDCEYWPDSVHAPNLSSTGTNTLSQSGQSSQLEHGQSMLWLKTQPQIFSKEAKTKFHTNFLRMWIAMRAFYWSADQLEEQNFFKKWVEIKIFSWYQC